MLLMAFVAIWEALNVQICLIIIPIVMQFILIATFFLSFSFLNSPLTLLNRSLIRHYFNNFAACETWKNAFKEISVSSPDTNETFKSGRGHSIIYITITQKWMRKFHFYFSLQLLNWFLYSDFFWWTFKQH